jgi:Holliday junction resolvasome RuvABC ATP-dependent DNA helicase subunit
MTEPKRSDIIGQKAAMLLLDTVAPAHVLFTGPPGIGKTMIATWYASTVSERWGSPLNGTVADENLSAIRQFKGSLIIDEAHMMKEAEALYPMLDAEVDKGIYMEVHDDYSTTSTPYCKTFCFTTTDEGELPYALVSRLIHVSLAPYSQAELAQIGQQVGINLHQDVLMRLAQYGRGSPRRTKLLSRLVQKIAWDARRKSIELWEVEGVLKRLGYNQGLTQREVSLLVALEQSHRSISTLCAMMATGRNTVRMVESELIHAGLVTISSKGRSLTSEGREVLRKVKGG